MVENAAGSPIVDRLAGKTILLTGVTGFLGQVIFERLLGDVPEGRIVLLVRVADGINAARSRGVPVPQAGVRRAPGRGSATTGCARSWTSG